MQRLILWPGLAADERMYRGLDAGGWDLVTPRLPTPEAGEAFAAYARRCAEELEVSAEDLVGGCSFGALVASEIARTRPVRALVLLAGALDSHAISAPARWLGRLPVLLPLSWLRRFFASDANLRRFFGTRDEEGYALARQMLDATEDAMLRYGGRMAVSQRPAAGPQVPVYALHGSDDRVMSPPPLATCRLVPGAGHGLVFSHAAAVNDFLRDLKEDLR